MAVHTNLFNSGVLVDYCYKVVGRLQEYPNDAETGTPVENVLKELTPLIVEIYHDALNRVVAFKIPLIWMFILVLAQRRVTATDAAGS